MLLFLMMTGNLPEVDFQRFWRRLQQIGLNAYEARSYLVLVGHSRFKALDVAARAHVPRQKIYEVLDSLVEKGFAQVIQEKTKLFSAIEPALAIPNFIDRRAELLRREWRERGRLAGGLVQELATQYGDGREARGTLDYLQIVGDPGQIAAQYRRMLGEVREEYLEFSRPPYAVDPLEEHLVKQARSRGVHCRLLLEAGSLDELHLQLLHDYGAAGVEVRQAESLPMKLALFDGTVGMIALLDPVVTRPSWTAIMFTHAGMGEAMQGLFESYWKRSGGLARSA